MSKYDLSKFTRDYPEKPVIRSERKLRIGLIGTGGIANNHIKSYVVFDDVEVVAGADLIEGKAEKFFKKRGVEAKPFTDYKEMIDTMELDAVSVCTYNSTHAECAIYALEHGVNVLLEKPMCVTMDEAKAIMQAEKKSGKLLSIGFQPRFDANMQMIKKIVDSGELGKVFYAQVGGGRRNNIPVGWSDSFIKEETAGFGALGDIGCYAIDLVMNALGNPRPLTVTGTTTDYFGTTPEAYTVKGRPECAEMFTVDDFASAYIRLEGGLVIDFRTAWYMHLDTPGDTILMGTKGSLRIPSTECWNGTFEKPMTLYHTVAGIPTQTEIPLLPATENLFDIKIRTFLDAIITGGDSPVPSSQIIYNQALLSAIKESSDCGREVEVKIPEI